MNDEKAVKRYMIRRNERLTKRGVRLDAKWDNDKHPRDESGKFTSKSGGTDKGVDNYDVESGPIGKFKKMFENPADVSDLINKYYNESSGWWTFGIRADKPGKKAGHVFKNSHQWFQDDPSDWGGSGKYSKRKGMWDAGELNGVSTVGMKEGNGKLRAEDVEKAINRAKQYADGQMSSLYLVGTGKGAEGGNDTGEVILENGICFGEIKVKEE